MKAILIASKWRLTKARRERVGSLAAKFAEILFWLVVVGPFVMGRRIAVREWLLSVLGLVVAVATTYWNAPRIERRMR
jgi:hypothetical protein